MTFRKRCAGGPERKREAQQHVIQLRGGVRYKSRSEDVNASSSHVWVDAKNGIHHGTEGLCTWSGFHACSSVLHDMAHAGVQTCQVYIQTDLMSLMRNSVGSRLKSKECLTSHRTLQCVNIGRSTRKFKFIFAPGTADTGTIHGDLMVKALAAYVCRLKEVSPFPHMVDAPVVEGHCVRSTHALARCPRTLPLGCALGPGNGRSKTAM